MSESPRLSNSLTNSPPPPPSSAVRTPRKSYKPFSSTSTLTPSLSKVLLSPSVLSSARSTQPPRRSSNTLPRSLGCQSFPFHPAPLALPLSNSSRWWRAFRVRPGIGSEVLGTLPSVDPPGRLEVAASPCRRLNAAVGPIPLLFLEPL